MNSAFQNPEDSQTRTIIAAIRKETEAYGIDESRVSVVGNKPAGTVLSIKVLIDDADSNPLLIDTKEFEASLAGQMDVLRGWLGAGHPRQSIQEQSFRFKAGERVPAPDTDEPLVAARDSYNSRVWAVSERDFNRPVFPDGARAAEIPYLILPDGSLFREFQHGLPD